MLIMKILVTAAMVLALSAISERVGPRTAGILAGFPLGIAVSLFFIGLEQGAAFAAQSSVSAIGGLGAALVFCAAYWQASARLTVMNAAGSSVAAILAFLGAAAIIRALPQDRWVLLGVVAALTVAAAFAFRGIKVEGGGTRPRIKLGPRVLAFRAGLASALVLLITGLAGVVGETWAGLLSGFPVTLYPVLLIAHLTYAKEVAHGIIKGFPFGIGSLVICALAASALLEPLGVYGGMAAAIALAGIYLATVSVVVRREGSRKPAA
ncbi:MAG: hypothetical protein AAGD34_20370 [Pseudomonadota bacterium]